MATDWNALAKLGAAAFAKDKPTAVPVRRKPGVATPTVDEKPATLAYIPVMFADDPLCPEWHELLAWARRAPTEAFEILPCRAPDKYAKSLRYTAKTSLQAAILAELDEAGLAVVPGLIYELRTLRERWERKTCA